MQIWLMELLKGTVTLFLNPLFYWAFILAIIVSYRRIKKERHFFGSKVFNYFSEIKNTWVVSIVFGIIISTLAISFGIILTQEVLLALIVVVIVFSITGNLSFLSASYTIGITYLLVVVLPQLLPESYSFFDRFKLLETKHYMSLVMLLGCLLLAEAVLIQLSKNDRTYPFLTKSRRGRWIGGHQLNKLCVIPFFSFIPTEAITEIAPIFPYFHLGEQSYSLVLIPFIIGANYRILSDLPKRAIQQLAQSTFILSLFVLLFIVLSIYYPILMIASVILGIIGREFLIYRYRLKDSRKSALFTSLNEGIKVLSTMPDGPAERLGIEVGEVILKVNGKLVSTSGEFYEALQNSGAFFKLDIIDVSGEVRFITSAFFEEDHHELGLIFAEKPFRDAN